MLLQYTHHYHKYIYLSNRKFLITKIQHFFSPAYHMLLSGMLLALKHFSDTLKMKLGTIGNGM